MALGLLLVIFIARGIQFENGVIMASHNPQSRLNGVIACTVFLMLAAGCAKQADKIQAPSATVASNSGTNPGSNPGGNPGGTPAVDPGGAGSGGSSSISAALVGSWSSGCVITADAYQTYNVVFTLTFTSDGRRIVQEDTYQDFDSDCSIGAYMSTQYQGAYSLTSNPDGSAKIDYSTGVTAYKLFATNLAEDWNNRKICGKTDWRSGTDAGAQVDIVSGMSCYRAPISLFSSITISGTKLSQAMFTAQFPGDTAAHRPTNLTAGNVQTYTKK